MAADRNRRRMVLVLAFLVLVTGCAKRPATTTGAVPPPTGSGAPTSAPAVAAAPTPKPSGLGATTPTPSLAAGPSGVGGPATPGTRGTPEATSRPSPLAEFVAVAEVKDIHFDFDRYDIRPDAARILDDNAAWLNANPRHLVLLEGHADERGTNEYNLALGERRAKAAMHYLAARGVQAGRITVISYGEERPLCTEKTEGCWARNRRAHFLVKRQ